MLDSYVRFLELVDHCKDPAVVESAVDRLMAHLTATGRLKILPVLVRVLHKRSAHRHRLTSRIDIADESETEKALAEAAQFGIVTKRVIVTPSLIRGWRGQQQGKLIDRSAKHALISIYQKVIA
jgi:F0F1-type ATP synthase delta subunit